MLRTLLQQIPYFTPDDIAAFEPLWKKQVQLNRYDFLIRQGQVEQGLYFVTTGALRIYYPLPDEDICVGFGYPNTLMISFPSFVDGKPSAYYIQALKKSELLGISKTDLVNLMEERPNIKRFWYEQLEKALVGKMEREDNSITKTKQIKESVRYYVATDGKLTKISKSKKSVLESLGNNKQALETYIQDNRLNLKEDADLAKLITYYNTL